MASANTFRLGIVLTVVSAMAFSTSGSFAKSLMGAGWTPAAIVAVRLAGGALVMVLFATIVHRRWLHEARQHGKTVLAYGVFPIAGAQLCYFNAVSHLSVGVALLLEYLAPVLVVGWVWGTSGRRPGALTLAGTALALAGTLVVLDVFSGLRFETIGVIWALTAAVCLACYFVLSHRVSAEGSGLSWVTLSAGGLVVGTLTVVLVGLAGVLPFAVSANDAVIAGQVVPVVVPVVVLGVVSTALAYTLGISGVSRLRPNYASLLGLIEVLCAVLWAWLLLCEPITLVQGIGGGLVLLGLALAGLDRNRDGTPTTRPEMGHVDTWQEEADRAPSYAD